MFRVTITAYDQRSTLIYLFCIWINMNRNISFGTLLFFFFLFWPTPPDDSGRLPCRWNGMHAKSYINVHGGVSCTCVPVVSRGQRFSTRDGRKPLDPLDVHDRVHVYTDYLNICTRAVERNVKWRGRWTSAFYTSFTADRKALEESCQFSIAYLQFNYSVVAVNRSARMFFPCSAELLKLFVDVMKTKNKLGLLSISLRTPGPDDCYPTVL